MGNVAKGSIFNIKVDFEKSKGSHLYDKNTSRSYLDFFGMYASLPLGYNHKIFQDPGFHDEIRRCSHIKVTNCEFLSSETEEFDKIFSEYCGQGKFSNFHYCSTGALAVEASIKTSLHYKNYNSLNILSFKNSFHGVNSYGGFITDRFYSSKKRLAGLPEMFSTKCDYDLEQVEGYLSDENNPVTCMIVEPIQCTAGDIHHDIRFFGKIRELCTKYDVPLIFDEIQIGFGGTGKLWYFEHLGIIPDMVLFGKKAQVSGLMVVGKYSGIFDAENINRLEVTWNSDTLDMIRSKYIINAYEEYNILDNVIAREKTIIEKLSQISSINDLRSKGLIIGFDLKDSATRNKFMDRLYNKGMICNSTGYRSIRLRPNLALSSEDALAGCRLIEESLDEI
tara:strand:- start:13863 stop:15041 length:1179 start_codon:yes stop_codon:yes gene_type:complete